MPLRIRNSLILLFFIFSIQHTTAYEFATLESAYGITLDDHRRLSIPGNPEILDTPKAPFLRLYNYETQSMTDLPVSRTAKGAPYIDIEGEVFFLDHLPRIVNAVEPPTQPALYLPSSPNLPPAPLLPTTSPMVNTEPVSVECAALRRNNAQQHLRIQELLHRLSAAEQKLQEWQLEKKTMEQEFRGLVFNLNQSETKARELQSQIDTQCREHAETIEYETARKAEIQRKNADLEQQLRESRTSVKELEVQLQQQSARLREHSTRSTPNEQIKPLKKTLKSKELELVQTRAQIDTLQRQKDELARETNRLREKNKKMKQDAESKDQRLLSSSRQLKETEQALQEYQQQAKAHRQTNRVDASTQTTEEETAKVSPLEDQAIALEEKETETKPKTTRKKKKNKKKLPPIDPDIAFLDEVIASKAAAQPQPPSELIEELSREIKQIRQRNVASGNKKQKPFDNQILHDHYSKLLTISAHHGDSTLAATLLVQRISYQCYYGYLEAGADFNPMVDLILDILERFPDAMESAFSFSMLFLLRNAFVTEVDTGKALPLNEDKSVKRLEEAFKTRRPRVISLMEGYLPTEVTTRKHILPLLHVVLVALILDEQPLLDKALDRVPDDRTFQKLVEDYDLGSAASDQARYLVHSAIYIQKLALRLIDGLLENESAEVLRIQAIKQSLEILIAGVEAHIDDFIKGEKEANRSITELPVGYPSISGVEWELLTEDLLLRTQKEQPDDNLLTEEDSSRLMKTRTSNTFIHHLRAVQAKQPAPDLQLLDPENMLEPLGLAAHYTPGDGLCLFHAVLQGAGIFQNADITPQQFIQQLINNAINQIPQDPGFLTLQEHMQQNGLTPPETTLETLINQLLDIAGQAGEKEDQWGTLDLLGLIVHFINQPVLVLLTTGNSHDPQHPGYLIQPAGVSGITYDGIKALLQQQHHNMLILGFAANGPHGQFNHWFHIEHAENTLHPPAVQHLMGVDETTPQLPPPESKRLPRLEDEYDDQILGAKIFSSQ